MPFSPIDLLPTAPQRDDDPQTFIDRADAFVAALTVFGTQINVFKNELEATAALIAVAPAYADPGLLALTGLAPAADKLAYFTSGAASALTDLTATGRSLIAAASAPAARDVLGLGTAATHPAGDFEDAGAVSAHVAASDPHGQYLLESAVSSFIMGLLDDADATAARATLGVPEAITYTAAGAGWAIAIPIGGTTYYLQMAEGSNVTSEGTQSITWPIAFPNACLFAQAGTKITGSDTSVDIWYQVNGTPGTSSISVMAGRSTSGSSGTGAAPTVIGFGY